MEATGAATGAWLQWAIWIMNLWEDNVRLYVYM